MDIMRNIKETLINSGITIGTANAYPTRIKKILRLKINPIIINNTNQWEKFSRILSEINIGWTFKTVQKNRHLIGDEYINKLIKKSGSTINMADIGCSDWSGSIGIYIKNKQKLKIYDLYDKTVAIRQRKTLIVNYYYNQENTVVYKQIWPILVYCFPRQEKISPNTNDKMIDLTNPEIKKLWLKIKHLNVFYDVPTQKYDIIKCANLLHTSYFTTKEIKIALQKIAQYTKSGWYLILIHNNKKYKQGEAILCLQKGQNNKRRIIDDINNYWPFYC